MQETEWAPGSSVCGHNPCFIFITVDAKLLSTWSKQESRFLVVFSRLLNNFPWRFPCTNTTSSAAGDVVVGRFFSLGGSAPVYFLQRMLVCDCGGIYLNESFESPAAGKGAREEATLDKHSFQIK